MHILLSYVSRQLGAHAPLLQGRVGAGADAKLAVDVSRHRKKCDEEQPKISGWLLENPRL